tara:strand:+ start:74 stop:487 length:414 start_codon:yes stop_codon:yes gene_type:complete
MTQTIFYEELAVMEPRPGVSYATTYVKQSPEHRKQLVKHIKMVVEEIMDYVGDSEDWVDWMRTPLKGFKTTSGQNRSFIDLVNDMINEAGGTKRDGTPKDFALAPIERWNKLFKGSDYAVTLKEFQGHNLFNKLMEF